MFLSYARADAAVAEQVAGVLAAAGVRVWQDVTAIAGGSYKERIVSGMRWAKVVLAVCSPHSLASPNVAAELDLAWDDLKKPVVQVWATDRKACTIPDRLLMVLTAAVQYVSLSAHPPAVWGPVLLANLAEYGVGRGPARPPPPVTSPPPPVFSPKLELLDTPARAAEAQVATARRLGTEPHWTNTLGMSFRLIPAGEFVFGPSDDHPTADPYSGVRVAVRSPFWMATEPLPLRVVRDFLRDPDVDRPLRADKLFCPDARTSADGDLPATLVSLTDVDAICKWLSVRDERAYWVPSEVEWEHAARAGYGTTRPPRMPLPPATGVSLPDLQRASAFGVWDVLGNVCEWTTSVYLPDHSAAATSASPLISAAAARTVRGCGWRTPPADVRLCGRKSQATTRRADDLGVRLLCQAADG